MRELLKRSPGVVAHWDGDQFVIENYVTKQRLVAGARIIEVLNHFGRWRSLRALLDSSPASQRERIRRLVTRLIARSFLERSGHRTARARALESWQPWHPAASFFHFATRNVPFAASFKGHETVGRDLIRRKESQPSPVKRYLGRPAVVLPAPEITGELPSTLLNRRTWRRFSDRPIDRQSLSTLLSLSFGAQHKITLPVVGTFFLTTSPSGGARHPIEPYVVVQKATGVPAGIYHYEKDTHRLVRLRGRLSPSAVNAFFPGQRWCARAPVFVVMTAVFRRTQWKYPHPHAYRVVLAEAGHVCQTFCLVATWLGLAPYCTMALADAAIEKALGVDGVAEPVVYVAGAGHRPAGAAWALWPDKDARMPRVHPIYLKTRVK